MGRDCFSQKTPTSSSLKHLAMYKAAQLPGLHSQRSGFHHTQILQSKPTIALQTIRPVKMRLPNLLVSLLALTFTTSALPTIAPSYEDEELNVTANSHDLRTRDGYASHIWIEVFQDAYFSGTGRWAGAPKDVCSMSSPTLWNLLHHFAALH